MKVNNSLKRISAQVAQPSSEPWAIAIRQRYGADDQLLRCWSPDNRGYCATHMDGAASSPATVQMLKSYPTSFPIALQNVIARTVLDMADADNPVTTADDVMQTANLILSDNRLRVLPVGVMWAFFHRAACRRYPIYGKHATPQKLLGILQQQSDNLMSEALAELAKKEQAAKREAEAQHQATAITWAEYAERKGLKGVSPVEYITGEKKEGEQ